MSLLNFARQRAFESRGRNLTQLISKVPGVLGSAKTIAEKRDVGMELLDRYDGNNCRELERFLFYKEKAYARNLIHIEGAFSLMVLTWPGGILSPLHGHTSQGCWVKVIRGTMRERVYKLEEDGLPVLR